jgi:hypothetical protein
MGVEVLKLGFTPYIPAQDMLFGLQGLKLSYNLCMKISNTFLNK